MVAADPRMRVEVVEELKAYERGRLDMLADYGPMEGGGWAVCGTNQDLAHWTVAYVRANRAVLPLVVGERDRVVQEFARIRRERIPVWDAAQCPPPTVLVDKVAYHFTAAHGRRLVGVVRCKRGAVVLAALGDEIAVIEVVGQRTSILHVGKPCSFREIDVDAWRRAQHSGVRDAEPAPPRRPPRAIRAEHRRIVHGIEVDVADGPTVAEVLEASFADLAERALALASTMEREFKGQTKVAYVTGFLCKMALLGLGNLARRISGHIDLIKEYFPEFEITAALFADVLTLLEATGTCVIAPRKPRQRIRQLNLEGLSNPRSPEHRRLCRETRSRHPRGRTERVDAVIGTRAPRDVARSAKDAPSSASTRDDTRSQSPARPPAPVQDTTPTEITAIFRTAAATMLDAAAAAKMVPRATTDAFLSSPPDPSTNPGTADAAPIEATPIAANNVADADGAQDGAHDTTVVPSAPDLVAEAASQTYGVDLGGQAAPAYEEQFFDVIKSVDALGPAAGQTLLLSICVGRGWIANVCDPRSDETGAPPVQVDVVPDGEARPASEVPRLSPGRRRRRLHLSQDHTFELPIVASILTRAGKPGRPPDQAQGERGRDQVLGRSRSVGGLPGILGARGPPILGAT